MDFSYTPDEEAFRLRARQWLEANAPRDIPDRGFSLPTDPASIEKLRDWQRRLFDAGFLGISWPIEYGGQGSHRLERDLQRRDGASPRPVGAQPDRALDGGADDPGARDRRAAAALRAENSACEEIWCQGFSEPGSGSDLAALASRAELEGDEFIVNGAKVWTSLGHISDWCMLLVRTEPDAPKHRGLSYLLVDMHSPGVTVRPLRQMTGEAEFNQLFFDDVRVPRKNLLGPQGGGWGVALTTLMNERATLSLSIVARFGNTFEDLKQLALRALEQRTTPLSASVIRQALAQFYIDVESMKYLAYRNFSRLLRGGTPGPEGSISKLLWSELNQRMNEFALAVQGPHAVLEEGSPHVIEDGRWQYGTLRARGNTIEEGTSEIQRSIIAERLLGMPKGY